MIHPFFWSAEKRLNFLVDVSDHFEWEPRDPPSHDLQILEATGPEVLGTDFLRRLDKAFIDTLGKQRKYTGSKMLDLLRALRNKVRISTTYVSSFLLYQQAAAMGTHFASVSQFN